MNALRDMLAAPFLWAGQKILGFSESAQRFSTDRGWLPGLDRDARLDLTQVDLAEQRRKAKYFEANTELVTAMGSVFEQYTVGSSGLRTTAASSSPTYNSIADEIFVEWSQFAEINSRRGLSESLSLSAYTWFVQGECYLLKTFGEGPDFRPRIQVIEPHRVFSDRFASDDKVSDGIETDKNGRVVAYHIATGKDAGETRRIKAPAIIHICEPSRAGQVRCGPLFSNVMGYLQDIEQIQRNYLRGSKVSSALAAVFKNQEKQVPTSDAARALRANPSLRTSTNTSSTEAREQHVRRMVGAEILAMRPDESVEFPLNNNPTQSQRDFIEFTISRICIGACIPPQLVMPRSLQGTVTRADLDRAASMFRMRSQVLQRAAKEIRNWVLEDAHKYDPRFAGVEIPADWWKCNCRPPRQVNVDVGRNATALLSEYRAGIRTLESIVGELGDSWEETIEQKAIEARKIADIARKHGVPASSITDSVFAEPAAPLPA